MASQKFAEPGGPRGGTARLALSKEERRGMAEMRYGDGRPMERGDLVAVAGEPGRLRYRIAGWDPVRVLVLLRGSDGRVSRVPPAALVRC